MWAKRAKSSTLGFRPTTEVILSRNHAVADPKVRIQNVRNAVITGESGEREGG